MLAAAPAAADTRIAFVAALSGPAAAAGRDQRDGFLLAVAEQHGRLGGVPVRVSQLDDRGDSERAAAIGESLLAEGVRYVTGLTTSGSALALQRKLQGKPVVIVSSGAGPASLAGSRCSRNFFSSASPDDAVHENAGAIARARRYQKVALVGPPGSRKAIEAAFRRQYRGELLSVSSQEDIRRNPPDAVYVALRGQQMRSFLSAYEQAGFFHRIPVIAARVEPEVLQALGPDYAGLIVSVRWAAGMQAEASARFVEAFNARYGRAPSSHAMQAYDAAQLLSAAFRAAGGTSAAPTAVAKALSNVQVQGVAGPIRLAANGFALANWHAWEVFNESSGTPYLVARERTLEEYAGPRVGSCRGKSG